MTGLLSSSEIWDLWKESAAHDIVYFEEEKIVGFAKDAHHRNSQ